jgi:hypothetical protein
VDSLDFEVVNGVLRKRVHAARMLNNIQDRKALTGAGPVDAPESDWPIPGYDTVEYELGSAIVADPGSGRFIVREAGLYNIQAAQGDNEFETNAGASLYLTIFVGGTSYARGSAVKVGGDRAWINVSDTLQIPAGATVSLHFTLRYCNPPAPPDPPFCGRADHWLNKDNRNHFTITRVGSLYG